MFVSQKVRRDVEDCDTNFHIYCHVHLQFIRLLFREKYFLEIAFRVVIEIERERERKKNNVYSETV